MHPRNAGGKRNSQPSTEGDLPEKGSCNEIGQGTLSARSRRGERTSRSTLVPKNSGVSEPNNDPNQKDSILKSGQEVTFSGAWTGERCNADTVKRALCQMPPVKLERKVLARLQGLHPPWIRDDDWEYFIIFVLEVEGRKAGSVVLPNADPRHPGYNGTSQRVAPNPVIVECSGLGGGDLKLAQPWHVCIRTNKHKQQVYGPQRNLSASNCSALSFVNPSANCLSDDTQRSEPSMLPSCSFTTLISKDVRLSVTDVVTDSRWYESYKAFASVTRHGCNELWASNSSLSDR